MRIDSNYERLSLALKRKIMRAREKLEYLSSVANKYTADNLISQRRDKLLRLKEKAEWFIEISLNKARERLMVNVGKTDALSPLSILSRGYSVAEKNGRVVNSASEIQIGDDIDLIMCDGIVHASVTEIKKEK